MFSYPTVHTQQSTVPPGVAEHNVTVARAFTGQPGASDRPGRKTGSWSRRCSWAACSTRTTRASEHFHFLSVLAGTYDDTVRAGYLRHIAGFPTERVPKMPLSGVSTRSGDLARFTFKALDGTMTDVFIHLIAYQLATLSGTGVSEAYRPAGSIPPGRGSFLQTSALGNSFFFLEPRRIITERRIFPPPACSP